MTKRGDEVWYTPGMDGIFETPSDKEDEPPEREGYFEYWGTYSTIEIAASPQGNIPIPLSLTVGIIRDKLTGQCCMALVHKIRFKQ